MSEPRLRRELLSITADQWGQILEACPAVGHELRPVVRRRPGSRHEVDGRWVKRWVDQPQQHRGQLEGAVRRWTLSLLHWTDNGLDLPATSEAWAEAVHGVSMRDGRAPAMLCRAYARSLGYAIEVGKGGNAQLEGVATPLAAAPEVADSTPGPPDSEHEPDDAAVPGGDRAEALTKAQEIADVLAEALREAAEQVSAGHPMPDLTEPDKAWRTTREDLIRQLELSADTDGGFERLAARVASLEEAERARRAAEDAEAEAARLAQEREGLLAELAQLEAALEQASPIARRGLALAREDVVARIAELGAVPDLSPAGEVPEPSPIDEPPKPSPTREAPRPSSARGVLVGTKEESEAGDAGPQPEPQGSTTPDSQAASDVEVPGIRTEVVTKDEDLSRSDSLRGSRADIAVRSVNGDTDHRARQAPQVVERQPALEHDGTARSSSLSMVSEQDSPPPTPEAPAPDSPTPVSVLAGDHAAADGAVVALATSARLAEAYWVEVASRPENLSADVLRYCAGAFSSGPYGIDPTDVLVDALRSLDPQLLKEGTDLAGATIAASARAGLSAGWVPYELLDQPLAESRLPEQWQEFLSAVAAAIHDGYQHRVDGAPVGGGPRATAADIASRCTQLRHELQGAGLVYQRASKVLRHLLRDDQALGAALYAVGQWAKGTLPVASLAERAATLTDPRDVGKILDEADRAVSSNQQRRNPIIATALQQLRHRVEQVAQLLLDAVSADAEQERGDGAPDRDRRQHLMDSANRCLPLPAGTLSAAVLALLRSWVLDPGAPRTPAAADVDDLLITASLPLSAVPRDGTGLPRAGSLDAAATVQRFTETPSPETLFAEYLERGDLATAARLEGAVDAGAARLREAAHDWIGYLEHQCQTVLSNLARLPVTVPVDAADRSAFEARLVSVRTYRGDRFDRAQADLRAVSAELDELQDRARADLRARLHSLTGRDPADRARIEAFIDAHDLTTAHEFLAFLERGDQLPAEDEDQLRVLDEFANLWRGPQAQSMSFDETLAALGGPQEGDRTTAGLRAWRALAGARTAVDATSSVRSVLRLIGLELSDLPSNESERARHGVFTFTTRNARPVDGSFVPGLGSRARRYIIRVVKERMTASALLDLIPSERRHEANLVLYLGRLGERDRRDLLTACRQRNTHVVVIDEIVVAYLAQRAPGSFRAMQQVTLPFSAFPHYAPYVAGDVADEVFVGRRKEMDEIASPTGSLFVYGGRQLGKSALLRRVERDFNRTPEHHAIYIDLKARGIGEFNEPEHLWAVLLEELKRVGLVPATFRSAKPEAVVHHVRDWLAADEERRLLLLLDEADLFLENEARQRTVQNRVARFPNVLQLKGLMDATNRRFKPVFAGLHQVQRLQNISNTPLAHGGQDIPIGPLLQSEARGLVLRPLSALGYRFASPDLVWRLLAVTNYQASLVQIVCFELVEQLTRRQPGRQEPPFVISAADVDAVVSDPEVQARIAQRFQLTIRLEDRYFVIALTVAVLSLDSGFREQYSAEDLLSWCRLYWPGGFDTLTTDQFGLYLDEMVGLGVLVRRPDGRYAVRSPNVVTMLGSREELEQQLHERADSFDLPHEYNPRATRRLVTRPDRRTERSPLTEQDLAAFFADGAAEAPPLVVIGNRALGLDRVPAVLQAVAVDRERGLELVTPDNLSQLQVRGAHLVDRRPIVAVDARHADAEATQAVLLAVSDASRHRRGQRAVLVGPAGFSAVAAYDPRLIRTMPLTRWTSEGLRSWNDSPFASPEHRDALLAASGGWPALVEAAVRDAESRLTFGEALSKVHAFPQDAASAATFLADVGLEGASELGLVRAWAEVTSPGEAVARPDLAELLELDASHLDALLSRLGWLGVITDVDGEPALEQVVRRTVLFEG